MAKKTNYQDSYSKAIELMDSENYQDAIPLLEEVNANAEIEPESQKEAIKELAFCLYMTDRYDEAIEQYERISDEPIFETADIHAFAYSLYHEDRYDDAFTLLTSDPKQFAKDSDAQVLLGLVCYYKQEPDFEMALKAFKLAAKLDKNQAEHFYIGDCLRLLGKHKEAVESLTKAASLHPNDAPTFYCLGLSLYQLGKTSEAVNAFKKAIENDDSNSDAYLELGKVYVAQGDYEAALPMLEKAMSLGNADAPAEMQNLSSIVFGNQAPPAPVTPQESSGKGWAYYNFPEGEADKSIHQYMQPTSNTSSSSFSGNLYLAFFGIFIGLALIAVLYFFDYERVNDFPPALDIELKAQFDTEFSSIGVFNQDEAYNRKIRRGTTLKPVAWVKGELLVELPNGERGMVDRKYIDLNYRVRLPKETGLYDSKAGGKLLDKIGEEGASGTNMVALNDISDNLQPVRLDNGKHYFVYRSALRSELNRLGIPSFNHDNRRLFHLGKLNEQLRGKSVNEAIGKVGMPSGIQKDASSGTEYIIFPYSMVTFMGQRFPHLALIVEDGKVLDVRGQGTPKRVRMDRLRFADEIIGLGITNIWLRSSPWFVSGDDSFFQTKIMAKSKWLGWILRIVLIILIIIVIILALIGLFGLPLVVAWPFMRFVGSISVFPNWLVRWIGYLILAAAFVGFYYVSIIAFNIQLGAFWFAVYGFGLAGYFYYLTASYSDYLTRVRCEHCKVIGCARGLGSVYLGLKKEIHYHDQYKESKLEGNVITHYYQKQRSLVNNYFYQDFYGCRICGRYWSWQNSSYSQRGDMDHSYPLNK